MDDVVLDYLGGGSTRVVFWERVRSSCDGLEGSKKGLWRRGVLNESYIGRLEMLKCCEKWFDCNEELDCNKWRNWDGWK